MARTFYRKQFSNYLGEQRAIDDIVLFFTADIGPTPTPTPSITPSNTPTPSITPSPTGTPIISVTSTPTSTPTNTPTRTPNVTSTPTSTSTPTPTTTSTGTPTPTPTGTPNPLCPQELILSASTSGYLYGLYTRATIYTGGTFETAWYNFDDNIMNYGTNPDGNDYVAFSINSGSDYTSLYWRSDIMGNDGNWALGYSTGNTLFNGGTLISSIILDTNSLIDGSLFFPPSGNLQYNGGYISYPASCPTPTPTATNTQTPTPTLTQTPYPLCPSSIVGTRLRSTVLMLSGTNTYDRITIYSGGTFNGGYITSTSFGNPIQFIVGAATDGNTYAVYGASTGSTYYQYMRVYSSGSDAGWVWVESTGNYIFNGGTLVNMSPVGLLVTGYTTSNSISYPNTGTVISPPFNMYYIAYPPICPTPTPTTTLTSTPTPTPTTIPSGFTPTSISGLTTWFEPTSGVTTSGGFVTSWTDQVGGRVATATSSTNFTQSTVLNGYSGITSPSSNVDSMNWATSDSYADFTIFGVVQRDSSGTNNPQYFMGSVTEQGIGAAYNDGTGYKPFIFDGNCGMVLQGGTDITVPEYLTWSLNSSSGFINQNGTQVATNSGCVYPQGVNRLFENTTAGFRALQGTIWEVLVYDRILTSTEIGLVENYLSSKYSL